MFNPGVKNIDLQKSHLIVAEHPTILIFPLKHLEIIPLTILGGRREKETMLRPLLPLEGDGASYRAHAGSEMHT